MKRSNLTPHLKIHLITCPIKHAFNTRVAQRNTPHQYQGPTTPGKLSRKDGTLEGNQGGYGGSGISNTINQATNGPPQGGGLPNPGDSVTGNKATITTQPRRREDIDTEDAARDTAGSVAEMAKAGVVGAMETGLKMGEMAKQTMDGMWGAAKKTTENVRDSVADDGGDNNNNNRNSKQKQVDDLRRGPRGYNY
ncbi:hypothetical protein DH2020_031677 [Rehmannia glutinosa]|uniref:Late embryogenesis abundant protein n=1 Tax=Rehmannia glutinosa TaxID=99300 RepID=A0ABR0VJ03_REHGL